MGPTTVVSQQVVENRLSLNANKPWILRELASRCMGFVWVCDAYVIQNRLKIITANRWFAS